MNDINYPSAEGYLIRRAKPEDLPEILNCMNEDFMKDETVFKSLLANNRVTEEEQMLIKEDNDRLTKAMFDSSVCLVAVHESSAKVAGVTITIFSKNPAVDASDGVTAIFTANAPRSPLLEDYFRYLKEIAEEAEIYKRFAEAEAAIELYAVAVHKDHRRKGLCKHLMNAAVSFAKTLPDVGFVFAICTSRYSNRSAEACDFKSILDRNLMDYKDSEGRPIFQDTRPHNIVSVVVLQI